MKTQIAALQLCDTDYPTGQTSPSITSSLAQFMSSLTQVIGVGMNHQRTPYNVMLPR